MTRHRLSFFPTLSALEAAGEGTRLRLLALVAEAELTVSELVTILGQSQPRVSRHLKLLVEAGLVERHREGAWAFFAAAEAALHVAEEKVEAAILDLLGSGPVRALLDLGTGTGRMLELLGGQAERAVGIDGSHAMLNVARTRIERSGLRNVQLRQGDLYALPVERDGYDVVVIHQVLHFLEEPGRALREAARVLRPGGRLLVVDFAPHADETLRSAHAHRRLGFARTEVEGFLRDAGLDPAGGGDLVPASGEGDQLTVSLWMGRDRRVLSDAPAILHQEVA